jgi:hypothetical protein
MESGSFSKLCVEDAIIRSRTPPEGAGVALVGLKGLFFKPVALHGNGATGSG